MKELHSEHRLKKSRISGFMGMCAAGLLIGGIFHLSPANAQQSCNYPPSGLISWWQGNGNANDTIGPNNGTLIGNVEFLPGIVGKAFYFDGDSFFQASTLGLPFGPDSKTIELWVNIDQQVSGTGEAFFAGYGSFGNLGQAYLLGANWYDPPGFFFSQWGYGIGYSPSNMTGQWHHVAVTNESDLVTLYVDGVQVGSQYMYIDTPPHTNFYMGRPGVDPDVDPYRRLQGLIDEVSVYNRALSEDEISKIYSAGSAGKCVPVFFKEFSPQISITFGSPSILSFGSSILLGTNSDGVNLEKEPFVLKIGDNLTADLPGGSFHKTGANYLYIGDINGTQCEVVVESSTVARALSVKAKLSGADLSGH